jgi:hypothetical protein
MLVAFVLSITQVTQYVIILKKITFFGDFITMFEKNLRDNDNQYKKCIKFFLLLWVKTKNNF